MPAAAAITARVFFALLPPPPLQAGLRGLARDTARAAHGRPVPAENMHVTLAFIGAWPLARLPALLRAGAAVRCERLSITLDRQGAFRRAGIAWIGPSDTPLALTRLASALGDALSAADVVLEARPFRPHLTLARHCRGPYPADSAGPFEWQVDAFALMQSQTRAEGARYSAMASWPLGVPA